MTHRDNDSQADDGTALIQALRNLWPILDKLSRQKAIDIANEIQPND